MACASFKANRRIWQPFVIAVAVMLALFTVICNVSQTDYISHLPPAKVVMDYGRWISAFFSLVFVLYGTSFVKRMLQKEMALYAMLGLERRHLRRLLLVMQGVFSLLAGGMGLALGYGLSLFFLLFLTRLMGLEHLALNLTAQGFLETVAIIAGIFLLDTLFAVVGAGRPPKQRTFLKRHPRASKGFTAGQSLLALGCLGSGYWLSLTVSGGYEAIKTFFIAVVLVMIGTWLLFSGLLVLILEGLQKRKGFYYRRVPFITIGGLLPRVRQHGVGLASVAILLTMAIVSISFTATMYKEPDVQYRMPYDYQLRYMGKVDQNQSIDAALDLLNDVTGRSQKAIKSFSKENGFAVKEMQTKRSYSAFVTLKGRQMNFSDRNGSQDGAFFAEFLSAEDCPRAKPAAGEVLVLSDKPSQSAAEMAFGKQKFQRVMPSAAEKKELLQALYGSQAKASQEMRPTLIFADDRALLSALTGLRAANPSGLISMNATLDWSVQPQGNKEDYLLPIQRALKAITAPGIEVQFVNSKRNLLAEFLQFKGSILFIGILLGLVFMTGVVLVTFFKQISEALADRKRYRTMQDIGMDDAMIHQVFARQVFTLFALPLGVAFIHALAAYPMINLILQFIGFNTANSYFLVILPVLLGAALAYGIAYQLITRTYENILKGSAM
ncbi:hypothetical protein SAMN04489866_10428 [Peptococcus niger]|uniref:ABC transport system permease protein n=2 Tax=Peptococcus niger TaxID=2741 RepID=A0A1G6VHZ2_PEPNI|nr:hypothetical protein SAMN04489866_10428 [Peptococcus niger]